MMPERIGYTVQLIEKHMGEVTMVFCERTESAYALSRRLDSKGIKHSMFVEGTDTLQDFSDGKTSILILVGKLREGFNDVRVSCLIMSSINIGTIRNTQTLGRAMRKDPNNPEKHSSIYLLIADGTSDTKVSTVLEYPKSKIKKVTIEQVVKKDWFA